jgi:hypothetical protein
LSRRSGAKAEANAKAGALPKSAQFRTNENECERKLAEQKPKQTRADYKSILKNRRPMANSAPDVPTNIEACVEHSLASRGAQMKT